MTPCRSFLSHIKTHFADDRSVTEDEDEGGGRENTNNPLGRVCKGKERQEMSHGVLLRWSILLFFPPDGGASSSSSNLPNETYTWFSTGFLSRNTRLVESYLEGRRGNPVGRRKPLHSHMTSHTSFPCQRKPNTPPSEGKKKGRGAIAHL